MIQPDGGLVAVGCQTGAVKGAPPPGAAALAGHKLMVYGIAFAPDGSALASASEDGTTKLSAATGKELASLQSRSVRRVRAVAYTPDGKLLAAANVDGTVSLWDVTTGKEKTALARPFQRGAEPGLSARRQGAGDGRCRWPCRLLGAGLGHEAA